jgi:uncharacterized protein (UPF0335 family)
MVNSTIKELVERLERVENEQKLLQEDKRNLFLDYKDVIDIKAFKAAWSILKKKESVDESALERILDIMNSDE